MNKSDDITLYTNKNFDTNINTSAIYVVNHFWKPNISILKIIEKYCITNKFITNLEIGPGIVPFSLATEFIGSNEKINSYTETDIDNQMFPYLNSHFDFIYCRHVLEDIQNPDFALKEMLRVSKNGYIETPSPLIEITKGVDGTQASSMYCGYIHHRYIVWSSIEKNEIYFLPKYSCILDHMLNITDITKQHMYNLINNYPVYWNNYFIYNLNNNNNNNNNNNKPKIIMYKNGINFNTKNGNMITEYITLVNRAINESIENTNYFVSNYKHLLLE